VFKHTRSLSGVSWYLLTTLVVIFVYCYAHILMVVRRQARVMHGHQQQQQAGSATTQASSSQHKMQASVTKTAIFLTLFFVLCWTPNNVYYILRQLVPAVSFNFPVYAVTLFLGLLNVCGNPFIYAANYDVIKMKLKKIVGRGQVLPSLQDTPHT